MPDVLTHLLVGVSIALLVRRDDNRREQMMVVIGAVVIDIERPFTWFLSVTEFYWLELGTAFHSVLGAIVLAFAVSALFDIEQSRLQTRFWLILLGCASHLLLDLIMYPWVEVGLLLLYPLKIPFSFNLLWPDFWLYPLIGFGSLLLALGCKYISNYRVNENGNKSDI